MATVAFAASFLPPTNRVIALRNRHVISLSASASASPSAASAASSSSSSSSASSSVWKQVIDPQSAQPYYWNTQTNKTCWEIPEGWTKERHSRFDVDDDDEDATRIQESSKLSFEDLTSLLLNAVAVDSSRFGDVANQYRPQCFENEYFDYLTNMIDSIQDNEKKEAFIGLRARLANPLLKNPPPY